MTTHPHQFTAQKRDAYLARVDEERELARLQAQVCGPFNPAKAIDARKPETAACPLWMSA